MPTIGVIGLGLSGLSLILSLLSTPGPLLNEIKGYERSLPPTDEASLDEKAGYGLTLTYAPGGALDRLGVLENCARADRRSREHYVFKDDGHVLGYYGGVYRDKRTRRTGQRGNLRVPRGKVRGMLIKGIREACKARGLEVDDVLFWGKELAALEQGQGAKAAEGAEPPLLTARFSDGSATPPLSLLVGCDGVNSRVQVLLASVLPPPLPPPTAMPVDCFLAIGRSTHVHRLIDSSAFHTLSGRARLFLMPYKEGETMWQLSFPLPHSECVKLRSLGRESILRRCLETVEGWHAPCPDILKETKASTVWGSGLLSREPVLINRKGRRTRVVCIGEVSPPLSRLF